MDARISEGDLRRRRHVLDGPAEPDAGVDGSGVDGLDRRL